MHKIRFKLLGIVANVIAEPTHPNAEQRTPEHTNNKTHKKNGQQHQQNGNALKMHFACALIGVGDIMSARTQMISSNELHAYAFFPLNRPHL